MNVLASYACRDHRKFTRERDVQVRLPIVPQVKDSWGTWQHPTHCLLAKVIHRIGVSAMTFSLRKEVIQPQVLLRLPCYDFTPIMSYTLDGCLPCGSAHRLLVQPTFVM